MATVADPCRLARSIALASALAIHIALVCGPARAAQTATLAPLVEDAIAGSLDRCLKAPATTSTLAIERCYSTARAAYDRAQRRTYLLVLKHLDATSRKLVARSQDAWTVARAANRAANAGPWTQGRGTVVGIEILQSELRAVRERIVALDLYWPGYSGEGTLAITADP